MAALENGRHGEKAELLDSAIGENTSLAERHQRLLLSLARNAIASYLRDGTVPPFETEDPELRRRSGVFVTLRIYPAGVGRAETEMPLPSLGRLRGCVGRIVADKPLYRAVQEMATRAALHDPRFPPLSSDELDLVRLEVSVLSPLQPVTSLRQVEVGRHGLVIEEGSYRGVLLPKVAASMGWDRRQFLDNLCRKAGLPRNTWPGKGTLFAFTAFDFAEPL